MMSPRDSKSWFRRTISLFVDSGVTPDTLGSDARYIRFLNATVLLFVLAQAPVLPLLITLNMQPQILINLAALVLCGLGFVLNRRGFHLPAKILIVAILTANTAYFAALIGSSAPTHLWLIPMAVLGLLVFKPTEWVWAAILVGLSMIGFILFEFFHHEMQPMVRLFTDRQEEFRAAQGSSINAMILTLILVSMMHRRFSRSEAALSREKAKSDQLLRAILPDKIARELRETGTTQAVRHEDVSLLFADIVGFTPLAASMPAEEVVAILASVFERVDGLIERCGVEKIKTIGDAYMIAGGVPQTTPDHAEQLARCALGIRRSWSNSAPSQVIICN